MIELHLIKKLKNQGEKEIIWEFAFSFIDDCAIQYITILIKFKQMGASQSYPFQQQLKSYKVIQKFPDSNITYLSHLDTSEEYLLKQLTYNDEGSYKKWLETHKKRQAIKEDHLTHLKRFEGKQIDHLCSNLYKIYALWEYPYRFLSDQISERSHQNRKFDDKDLWSILASSILALSTLQKNKIKHEMLTTKTILIDSDSLIKIADPLSIGELSNLDTVNRNRNAEGIYLSPEQCEALQSRGTFSNPYKNDVWTIGMILLQCGLLKNQSNCYKDEYQRMDYERIEKNLEQFGREYGEEFRFTIELMLKRDSKDRPDWVDLEPYARKNKEKQSMNSQNIKSYLQNTSNFTPASKNQRVSSFSPFITLSGNRPNSNTPNQYSPKPIGINRSLSMPISANLQPISYNVMPNPPNTNTYNSYAPSMNNSYTPFNAPNLSNTGSSFQTATFPMASSLNNNYISTVNPIGPMNSTLSFNNFYNPSQNNIFPTAFPPHEHNYPQIGFISTKPPFATLANGFSEPKSKYEEWKNTQPQINYLSTNRTGKNLSYSVQPPESLKNDYFKVDFARVEPKFQFPKQDFLKPTQFGATYPSSSSSNYYIAASNQYHYPNNTSSNTNNFYANNELVSNNRSYSNLVTKPTLSNQQLATNNNSWKKYEAVTGKKQIASSIPTSIAGTPSQNYNNGYASNNLITQQSNKNTYVDAIQAQSFQISNELQANQKPEFVIQTFKQGSKYEGFKLKDMRHGQGKFYYQDGGMYDGNWYRNKMNGYGSLYYQSGQLAYQGMWKEDQFQGKGKLYNQYPYILQGEFNFRDFDQIDDFWQYYEGDFIQDFKKGKGRLMLSNGQYFEGTFDNDMIQGPGIFYCKNGGIIKGIWRHNHLIQK